MAKRNLRLDIDGLLDAMKEAYRDCDEQKKSVLEGIKDVTKKAKPIDFNDEIELGRICNESRKILNDVIEKKIKLIQIHSKLVTSKSKDPEEEAANRMQTLSQEDIMRLRDDLKAEIQANNTYDLTE